MAGVGHQAQHIWRLQVTSSPCRHPSAHVLECLSFTKYSVRWGPVNAWLSRSSLLHLLKDTAGWLCKDTLTYTHTRAHTHQLLVMHILAFSLQEAHVFGRMETELLLFGLKMWKILIMFPCYFGNIWLAGKSRKWGFSGKWNACQLLACCLFLCAVWPL